ncbi:hypothetical protein FisN_2Hh268 [Fistulifera solaris]|jgi:hypothetical protein|uniref:Uncharacterized protein n=1 Tax=Fistulifera solaris TaxID=1519565 RepID=A0A1Z5JES3_FISSO|nr:hypothetical protein FisN_2Hh268 [Fistulifera solaris]|eukprot:GAX12436.1 hypothetical protein FisN_2Hh268 [Fistulifera solaris]
MSSTPENSKNASGHLSLLDDSPLKEKQSRTLCEEQCNPMLERASKWMAQLESIRDDYALLKVKNAILLDRLVMAGEDIDEN